MYMLMNVVFSIGLRMIVFILGGFVTSRMWQWFVMQQFHMELLSLPSATGLLIFVSFVTSALVEPEKLFTSMGRSEQATLVGGTPGAELGFWTKSHMSHIITIVVSYPLSLLVAYVIHVMISRQ